MKILIVETGPDNEKEFIKVGELVYVYTKDNELGGRGEIKSIDEHSIDVSLENCGDCHNNYDCDNFNCEVKYSLVTLPFDNIKWITKVVK